MIHICNLSCIPFLFKTLPLIHEHIFKMKHLSESLQLCLASTCLDNNAVTQ